MRFAYLVAGAALLASCSAPRFSSSIQKPQERADRYLVVSHYRPLTEDPAVASAEPANSVIAPTTAPLAETAIEPGKAEQKAAAKKTKWQVVDHNYASPYPAGLDEDLKWAIILAAAGMTSLFLMFISQIFGVMGGLMLIAGVVMFSRWVLRQ